MKQISFKKEGVFMSSLFTQAILKFLFGVLLVGALIFIPAGTLSFDRG